MGLGIIYVQTLTSTKSICRAEQQNLLLENEISNTQLSPHPTRLGSLPYSRQKARERVIGLVCCSNAEIENTKVKTLQPSPSEAILGEGDEPKRVGRGANCLCFFVC